MVWDGDNISPLMSRNARLRAKCWTGSADGLVLVQVYKLNALAPKVLVPSAAQDVKWLLLRARLVDDCVKGLQDSSSSSESGPMYMHRHERVHAGHVCTRV